MRKAVLVLVLIVAACASWPESIDLIVMVDTSESMFRVFPDLVSYLLTDLLTKRLRFGDTFHLLTFADTPEVEISSAVDTEQSIERILRRLFLLKPLGSYTDLVAALKFLAAYTRELPEGNRKTILLLTDGIHDPPPDSPYRLDPVEVRRQLFQTAQEIARAGWKVSILRLPQGSGAGAPATADQEVAVSPRGLTSAGGPEEPAGTAGTGGTPASGGTAGTGGTPASGGTAGAGRSPSSAETAGPDYVEDIARALRAPVADLGLGEQTQLAGAVGFPTIRFPERAIRGGRRLPVAFVVESASPEALYLELASVRLADGTELLQEPATAIVPPAGSSELRATLVMPATMAAGRHELEVELTFAGGLRASPSRGVIVVDFTGRPGIAAGALGRARAGGASLVFVLVAAAAVALVVLVALGLRSRVDLGSWIRSLGYSEGRYTRERAGGHPLIEMIVTMQNSHIGHRNVHSIRPGTSQSVGGGRSSYLIYFVSIPAGIAYVTYDGSTYTFVPVRAELFPGVAGPVADCLGREIPAVSPRGFAFTVVFRQFRSPLEEINDLLRSIRTREG